MEALFFRLTAMLQRSAAEGRQAELAAIRRKLHNLRRRKPADADPGPHFRCSPEHRTCLIIYIFSGYCVQVARDFVLGRGWRLHAAVSGQISEEDLCAVDRKIERASGEASAEFVVKLLTEPLEHFTLTLLAQAARYIVEHKLFAWVRNQNVRQGLAPSRAQLVERAIETIPDIAPVEVQDSLRGWLNHSSARSQRRWLASFRRRWGARIGQLRAASTIPIEEMQRKAGVR